MNKKIPSIIALALLVRLLLLIYAYPTWHHGFLDTDLAQNIVEGHGISVKEIDSDQNVYYLPTAQDMPGEAFLLAFFLWLTGSNSLLYSQILQILIDSLFCGVIYSMGKKLFSETVGLWGAFLFAIYLPEAYLAISPMRDVWVSFGIIGAIALILKFSKDNRWYFSSLAGLCLGLAFYFRPTVLFLPFFLALALLGLKKGVKKSLLAGIVMQITVFICIFPWVVRNYLVFDKMILARTVFYQSIWEGFGEFSNPFGAVLNDRLTQEQSRREGYVGSFASPDYDEFFKPKVVEAIVKEPLWVVTTIFKRIPYALLINRIPWGVLQDETLSYHKSYLNNEKQKSLWNYLIMILRLNPGFLITKCSDTFLLILTGIGIYFNRQNWKMLSIFLVVPIYFILVHIPIHIEGRYMVPGQWVFLIFASTALNKFWELAKKKRKNLLYA